MTRFIWVRDRDKVEHYINVNHIIDVKKIPSHGSYSAAGYIQLCDGKEIGLSLDNFDTANDVIAKIQVAMV